MTGWIKIPFGREVGLGRSDIVLDGHPTQFPPPQKGAETPIFRPCLLWPNGWMDQDSTWHGCRTRHRPHCVTWGSSSSKSGTAPPPFFGSCLLWLHGRPSQLLLSTCSYCLVIVFCFRKCLRIIRMLQTLTKLMLVNIVITADNMHKTAVTSINVFWTMMYVFDCLF